MDFPPLAPDRFSGKKLGKYEVLCRLSTGGMAEIYLAFQRGVAGFKKLVVLKKILPDIDEDEDIVRMFLDEARMTAQFNHPNIAQTYDLDVVDGELFLAMEFVPGATLIEVAQVTRKLDEAIPIGFSLTACRDTALALHYAHTFKDALGRPRQVIHRDVAEKNIMVTYEGTTKLLDFGIAKAKGRVTSTAVGKVKGTSGYMSPEQVVGDELDARSDIFSLGIVLHECLTGMRLFYGKDAESGMLAALNQDVAAPSESNPEVGRELDLVVLKALARKREDRYDSALDFARAIERAGGNRLWRTEQSGPFIQRLFKDRRDQTRLLLEGVGGHTGEIDLHQLFKSSRRAAEAATATPPPPPRAQSSAESSKNAAIEMLKSVAANSPPASRAHLPLPAPELALKSNPALNAPSQQDEEDEDEATILNSKVRAEPLPPMSDEDLAEQTIPVEMQGNRPSQETVPPRAARRPVPLSSPGAPAIDDRAWIGKSLIVAVALAIAAGLAAALYYFRVL